MRITRSILQSRVDRLNAVLNRPKTAYRKVVNVGGTTYHPNDGHFKLDCNSPGDGWTRYHLAMMLESGGETNVSHGCNAQEMFAYLRGVLDVLDTVYTHQFDVHALTTHHFGPCLECGASADSKTVRKGKTYHGHKPSCSHAKEVRP